MQDADRERLHTGTIVLLDGGHSTFLKGHNPSEVAADIEEARLANFEFVWFQPADRDDNSVAVDPNKVIAVIRSQRRPKSAL